MALPDNIFGSDSSSAVPGGNITKPLVIALLALLASRYFSGGQKDEPASAGADTPREPQISMPKAEPDPAPGSVIDGLGGLIEQFQKKGLGDTIDSWVNRGTNKGVAPKDVSVALGGDVVDQLSQRTGLPRDQVLAELARMLPNVVDKLTPEGRLPTRQEMMRLMS